MNAAVPCRERGGIPFDTESELFIWPSAQLFLVHEQEQALLQEGAFTLLLAHHSRSAHLVVVEASVGDVRWPVGKDCLVTALPATHPASIRSFLFALHLPASHDHLTYQLVLFYHDQSSPSSCVHQIDRLQALLSLYATFHLQQQKQPLSNPGPVNRSSMKELEEASAAYWTARVDDRDGQGVKQDTAGVCKEEAECEECELTLGGVRSLGSSSATTTSPAGVSKRMMKRMQKARRISAVSKLFCKAVVRGLINAKAHIIQDAECEARSNEQIITPDPLNNMEGLIDVKPVVANVDAITKVVEAVEGGIPKTMECSTRNTARRAHAGCRTVLDISALTTWTINELGLRLVLNAAMAKSMQEASISAPENLHEAGGEIARRPALSSSSSHLSSLHSTNPISVTTCPSARPHPRPPRHPHPPRRVNFLL